MDSGLLGGLAEGIKSGVASYQDARRTTLEEEARKKQLEREAEKMAFDRAMAERQAGLQERQYKASVADKDLIETDGGFQRTPEYLKEKEQKSISEKNKESLSAAERGLVFDRDEQGLIKGYRLDKGLIKPKEIDPMEAKLKQAQIKKIENELAQGPENKLANIAKKKEVEVVVDSLAKRDAGIIELDAAIKKLEDKNLPSDQKVIVGQMLIKKLNDPVFSDAVGAEEVKRLGSYLQRFSIDRPGSTFGYDIPRFVEQVRNKRDILQNVQNAQRQKVNELTGEGAQDVAQTVDPDAQKYAQMHNIPLEQASSIVAARKASFAGKPKEVTRGR